MALVPFRRPRDFQVAPVQYTTAVTGRPRAAPVPGNRANSRARTGRISTRKLMEACAERAWLHSLEILTAGLGSGLVVPLNDMNQGTANAQRLANQTRFIELEYCGYFLTACSFSFDTLRFVIFRDTQPEGALPTVADLLCTADPVSCFDPDFVGNQERPRFVILTNTFLAVQNKTPYTSGADNFVSRPLAGRLRMDFTTTYVGNAGTFADIQTNGLYLLLYSTQSSTKFQGSFCLKYLRM